MTDNEKARDLLAMIKGKEPGEFIVNSWWGSFVNDYKEALQMAIEALEQKEKTAAWVSTDEEPHEIYECNACGWLLYEEDTKDFRFCPSCGAKMEV